MEIRKYIIGNVHQKNEENQFLYESITPPEETFGGKEVRELITREKYLDDIEDLEQKIIGKEDIINCIDSLGNNPAARSVANRTQTL